MKHFIPHPYQLETIERGFDEDLAVFADPGLGKTVIALSIFNNLKTLRNVKTMLVIAPMRPAYSTWPAEIAKWSFCRGMTYNIMHGKDKCIKEDVDVNIINPEGLEWLVYELVRVYNKKKFPFDVLVADESTKFKNSSSKRFKHLKVFLQMFKRRIILTGTPMPNGFNDLWPQFYIIDLGEVFGDTKNKFNKKYFRPGGYNGWQWEIKSREHGEKLLEAARPICIVLRAEDHLDMPDLIVNDIYFELPDKARRQYRQMVNQLQTELDDVTVTAFSASSASVKLRQIINGAIYEDQKDPDNPTPTRLRNWLTIHDKKLEALGDLIEELQEKPLLVAYHFYHDRLRIKQYLESRFKFKVPYIGAGISGQKSTELVDQWNRKEIPVLLGHPVSMGHGLNMQEGGHDICWFSLDFDLEPYIQFNCRIFRQGVECNSVRIHRLLASRTIDDRIKDVLDNKDVTQNDAKQFLNDL